MMSWKEVKQKYLLMLIEKGELSNSQLDGMISEAQRMTSDRGHLAAATIDDMRRVIELHSTVPGDRVHYEFKYVILGNSSPAPIIFGDLITHEQVAHGRYVQSAGFCHLSQDEGAKCFGESISLRIKSDPERDAEIINRQFKLTEKYQY